MCDPGVVQFPLGPGRYVATDGRVTLVLYSSPSVLAGTSPPTRVVDPRVVTIPGGRRCAFAGGPVCAAPRVVPPRWSLFGRSSFGRSVITVPPATQSIDKGKGPSGQGCDKP